MYGGIAAPIEPECRIWCRFLGRRGRDGATHSVKTASEKRPGMKSRLGKRQR
jgi:hypothetical protein